MSVSPAANLTTLPLVLAGPILRQTSPESVAVWLVSKAPCRVLLRVVDGDGATVLEGEARTLAIGKHLFPCLVRAAAPNPILQPGIVYGYDLTFTPEDGSPSQSLEEAVGDPDAIRYPPFSGPTFVLPPADLNHLGLVYGSCRKPHGSGQDALAGLDRLLARTAGNCLDRPQQLFLLGDQIYADDVADCLLYLIMDAVQHLFGYDEPLPGRIKPDQLGPGRRKRLAHACHLTSLFSKSHLLRFSEFLVMYMMVWSDTLWPRELPNFAKVHPHHPKRAFGASKRRILFNQERKAVNRFRKTLGGVRRALANIATYMIFDDHEITDDWYLNREWTERTATHPLSRRMIANGMLGYAVCQGWGNAPQNFETGPESRLLSNLSTWCTTGFPAERAGNMDALLGLPEPKTKITKLARDPEKTCTWHFRVCGPRHEVWVLDTRTWRGFPGKKATDIPDLLSGAGWNQLREPARPQTEMVLVVAPTNVIDLPPTAWASKLMAFFRSVYHADYGDSWESQTEAFERLLGYLASNTYPEGHKHALTILSGDVHYGFAARIHYLGPRPYQAPSGNKELEVVMAHLTSSSFHNQNHLTRIFHRRGYWPPLPWNYAWAGWHERPKIHTRSWRGRIKAFFQMWRTRSPVHEPPLLNMGNMPREVHVEPLPDWRYRIDFLGGHRPAPERLPEPYPEFIGTQGRDIVGVNNFGLLQFLWPEDPDLRWIRQELWWYSSSGHIAPLTQFEIPLAFGEDEPFAIPRLPQEVEEEPGDED
ncbi:hypothetical protein SCOR_09150 [Sulfidibacter corallicola]|uniref:PhoD-like phosphatase n=1 Tax=Sulfidibacter corallicola TaxID=2818388 RepID=A0A8A4TM86_SULCO|nr:hypothetical protein [Sulfidibacter corallicola]QTD51076.1 hypothetical protein J3U87_01285 [Sulfidibacter corallicola]